MSDQSRSRPQPRETDESAHDVLAAEEFVVPAPDPQLHHELAHDVLAAEEFVVPTYDPELHQHGPVSLPEDPSGVQEPHDVLAAEEFALPAPRHGAGSGYARAGSAALRRVAVAGGALAGVALVLRRRRG